MQRNVVTVPRELMLQSKFEWDIDWRGQSTGESNAGFTQVVYSALPRWYGKPTLTLLAQDIPLWRAIKASARGRVNLYRVPIIDGIVTGRTIWDQFADGISLSNGEKLKNNLGFQYVPSMAIVRADEEGQLLVGSTLAAGSEYLIVADDMNLEYVPKIGAIYSINDFPYIVTEVRKLDAPLSSTVLPGEIPLYELKIETPLRKTINTMLPDGYSGDRVELLAYGIFSVETDTDGAITYGPEYSSKPKFNFVEWLR